METISDYNRYTQLMRNGFYDKMFWIDKIFDPWQSLLDFGCADGFQTKILAQIFPDKQVVGYDSDPDMINRARFTGSLPGNVRFTENPEEIPSGDVMYLSSIIHEIYSYNKIDQVNEFWQNVFTKDRKFVIIRDMGYSEMINTVSRTICNYRTMERLHTWFQDNGYGGELLRFEEHFGDIKEMKNLIHLLLKYPYVNSPNWMREVHENYLPVSIEEIERIAHKEGFVTDYKEQYTLPYLKWKWRTELGIDLHYNTHVKLIFRNTNQNL